MVFYFGLGENLCNEYEGGSTETIIFTGFSKLCNGRIGISFDAPIILINTFKECLKMNSDLCSISRVLVSPDVNVRCEV